VRRWRNAQKQRAGSAKPQRTSLASSASYLSRRAAFFITMGFRDNFRKIVRSAGEVASQLIDTTQNVIASGPLPS
jgi:hypothetical protein